MLKNRKAWCIAVACVLAVGLGAGAVTVFAAGADGQSVSHALNSKLQSVAQKLGINTAGMTDEQVKAVISENGAQGADLQKVQTEPTIDDLRATAADWGIDTNGMTEDQINQALADYKTSHQHDDGYSQTDKDAISQKLGIDVSGMTDEQINAALKENKPELAGDSQNADREPSIDDLKAAAVQWGIDISGMTDEQVSQAVLAYKIMLGQQQHGGGYKQNEKDAISQQLSIDTTGMTDDQITATLLEKTGPVTIQAQP